MLLGWTFDASIRQGYYEYNYILQCYPRRLMLPIISSTIKRRLSRPLSPFALLAPGLRRGRDGR